MTQIQSESIKKDLATVTAQLINLNDMAHTEYSKDAADSMQIGFKAISSLITTLFPGGIQKEVEVLAYEILDKQGMENNEEGGNEDEK